MTEIETEVLQVYLPDASAEEAATFVLAAFNRSFPGCVFDPETVRRVADYPEHPVAVDPVNGEWDAVATFEDPRRTGLITLWRADYAPAITDADDPVLTDGKWVWDGEERGPVFEVPEHITAEGGAVRIKHGLNCPVTVYAYADDGGRVNYLFAQPLSADEEHVELLPGAAQVTVTPDHLL